MHELKFYTFNGRMMEIFFLYLYIICEISSIDLNFQKGMAKVDSFAIFQLGYWIRISGSAFFFLPNSFLFLIFIMVILFKQFTWNESDTKINIFDAQFLQHKHCFSINKFAQKMKWGICQASLSLLWGGHKWNCQIRLS